MRVKLALKLVLAFALALMVGHYVFVGLFQRGVEPKSVESAPLTAVRAINTSPGATPEIQQPLRTVAAISPDHAPFAPGYPVDVDRNFVLKGGVWENNNVRMITDISADYRGGITHRTPHHMGGQVGWTPSGLELRQGTTVLTVLEAAGVSEARVEEHGGLKHVVYPSTYESTDEHLYVRPEGGIEHDIILKHQPVALSESTGLAYSGYLNVGAGLTMWDGKNPIVSDYKTRNGIAFKNRIGNTVFYLRPPVAYDATVTRRDGGMDSEKQALPANQRCATGCEYQLAFESGKVKLAVVTSGGWLSAPDRAYPVTIDPNFGANGLADGSPPVYVGAVGTDSIIPLQNGGGQQIIGQNVGKFCAGKKDNGFATIDMPFDFTFYPNNTPGGTLYYSKTAPNFFPVVNGVYPGPNSVTGQPMAELFVHLDGWISWDPPGVAPYCDEIPCDPGEDPCIDNASVNGKGNIPGGGYPDGGIYGCWNDLRLAHPTSGVYWQLDQAAVQPNRRLIIEWYKMGYVRDSTPNDTITFNIILYECQSVIEVIIAGVDSTSTGPTDGAGFFGDSTIGISSPDDSLAVVYDLYAPPAVDAGTVTPLQTTSITFSTSPLGNVTTTTSNTSGCLPLTACFTAKVTTVIPPCVLLAGGLSIPPDYQFHWIFADGSEAFTSSVCHVYNTPGIFAPNLIVTDQSGASATFINNLGVTVCDIPPVQISATPAGGTAPLTVKLLASSTTPYAANAAPPNPTVLVQTISAYDAPNTAFDIELQGDQNQPGVFTPYATVLGGLLTTVPTQGSKSTPVDTISSQVTFDTPGIYRVQAHFPATSFTLPTTGTGTIYIDVIDPNSTVANNVIITQSNFHIDWAGKIANSLGVAPNSADDSISLTGYINLVGLDLSTLAGQQVTVALNAYNPIFQGTLDANGKAVQGDAVTGKTGSFAVSMPSGKFTCTVTGDYAVSLGLTSQNLTSLLTANYRIQIGNVFNSPGTSISYGYNSNAAISAKGSYTFGKFFNTGSFFKGPIPGAPGGAGQPGGNETLVSGGFIVTAADLKLQGDIVNATITGLLSRAGGDSLRPSASSDVIIKVGNFSETLNFSLTPTFKTTGKANTQKFTFKSKGGTHVKSLTWSNLAGTFSVVINNMPNALVGINPANAKQALQLQFTVTPDSNQQFIGTTNFDIFKKSDTEYTH